MKGLIVRKFLKVYCCCYRYPFLRVITHKYETSKGTQRFFFLEPQQQNCSGSKSQHQSESGIQLYYLQVPGGFSCLLSPSIQKVQRAHQKKEETKEGQEEERTKHQRGTREEEARNKGRNRYRQEKNTARR